LKIALKINADLKIALKIKAARACNSPHFAEPKFKKSYALHVYGLFATFCIIINDEAKEPNMKQLFICPILLIYLTRCGLFCIPTSDI